MLPINGEFAIHAGFMRILGGQAFKFRDMI